MTEDLKRLLSKVYAVDTEAGNKLRYHIMRALACKDYADEIHFSDYKSHVSTIGNLFIWESTIEDQEYWYKIERLVHEGSKC